jgi:CRP-like cAMP-binding protein
MHASAIIAFLKRAESETGITFPALQQVVEHVRVTALRARAPAFTEGERCPRVFVVRSGLLKQLYTDENGSEWIKSFAFEGDPFGCPIALKGEPATFASVAIEPSIVESIEWSLVERLASEHTAWLQAVCIGFRRLAELKVRRERDLLMLTPEQLYRQFLEQSPQLAARVPQKELAGFLGVTPVGLNRIVQRVRREEATRPGRHCGSTPNRV